MHRQEIYKINSAKICGIIANNSSRMLWYRKKNYCVTLDSIRVIFADDSIIDTSDDNSVADFIKKKFTF